MISNARTDLAVETREMYSKSNQMEVPGVMVETEKLNDLTVTRVRIDTQEGSKIMSKAIGNYITVDAPDLNQGIKEVNDSAIEALGNEIQTLIKDTRPNGIVLIVGLGNWNVTPDALGPKVVSKIAVTRHITEYAKEYLEENVRPVCAVAPGVLGTTGIETGEIIKGIVEKVKPDLIIAIDALASRRMERISTTIQIADTGINPGSGVGNRRMGLTKETLGVPVIAVGVPTVVDAVTVANDSFDILINNLTKQAQEGSEFFNILKNMEESDKNDLIKEVLAPYVGELVVTPKEIDSIITNISDVVAGGINLALHGSMDKVEKYVN